MRIKEIDAARGFTVLIMPAVHVLMINSSPSTQASLLGKTFGFLAEGPGAQLFMLLMGMSFTLSRRKSLRDTLIKVFLLLCAAYSLNVLKFDVPILTGTMPQSFLNDHQIENNANGMMKLFLLGDILHLAAFALIVLRLIYPLSKYHIWAMLFAFVIIFISPVRLNDVPKNPLVKYFSDLLFANDVYVYFPVFPWLCYPLIGLGLGYYLNTIKNFFVICSYAGITLMITGKLLCISGFTLSCDNFYKTGAGGTLYHLGLVLLWLYLVHLAVKHLPSNRFFNLLEWLSRNITAVYIIQWICVFWMIGLGGYHRLGIMSSIIYICFISIFVFGFVYAIQQLSHVNKYFK